MKLSKAAFRNRLCQNNINSQEKFNQLFRLERFDLQYNLHIEI